MKPILVYVDDEPHNLTVFEAAMPSEWQIHVYDSPLKALDDMTKLNPWVVVSDQRMPGMMGVNFLEIVKKTHPQAKRVLVTGYSEEDLIIDSVRKAGVHDYIRKPWDVDDLCHRISQVVDTYKLELDNLQKSILLEKQYEDLKNLMTQLGNAKAEEERLINELAAWAPPFLLTALKDPSIKFPLRRDLALITFDIIDSSKIHDLNIDGKSVRSIVLKEFSESVIKHGGWRESHSGDSAYAHFGLLPNTQKPGESALAVASEFRTFLRNFNLKHNQNIECGVGLHMAKNVEIHVHTAEIQTLNGKIIQKSFDSSSPDVDLVHRMEKMTHTLPGSNVIMSRSFYDMIDGKIPGAIELGPHTFKGQKHACELILKPSDKADDKALGAFMSQFKKIAA